MRGSLLLQGSSIVALLLVCACSSEDPSSTGSGGAGSTTGAGSGGQTTSTSTGTMSGAGGAGTTTGAGGMSGAGGAGTTTGAGGMSGAGGAGSGGTGGMSGMGGLGAPCTSAQGGCDTGLYCDAPGCGAGTCQPKPPLGTLSQAFAPVCGCDHITYWNADLAAYRGAAVLAQGTCTGSNAVACSAMTPCPSGDKCNRQVGAMAQCGAGAQGTCWGVPLACPLSGPKGKACSNASCQTVCTLIQSQNPWWDDGTCP